MAGTIIIDQKVLEKIISEQGPEFEVAIKQAAIENALRRQIKAIVPGTVRKEMGALIEAETKKAVAELLGSIHDYTTTVTLRQKLVERIRAEAQNTAHDVIEQTIRDIKTYAEDRINARLPEVDSYVDRLLSKRLESILSNKLLTELTVQVATSWLNALDDNADTTK